MPKASMNEDHSVIALENEVRLPGQVVGMDPISKTYLMQEPSQLQLWLCIFTSDPSHHSGSGRLVNDIRQ
jgi:hypothetical protein